MGLYSSELDIDSEELDLVKPKSRRKKAKYKRKHKSEDEDEDEEEWPSSIPGDTGKGEGELEEEDNQKVLESEPIGDVTEEENQEVLESEPVREDGSEEDNNLVDTEEQRPSVGMSRAELRKMQEALTWQEGDAEHPNHLDLRVGKIITIARDSDYKYLYYSEIDLGGYDETRLVGTKLGHNYPNYLDLLNRFVVILCNVNPTDDRDIRSKTGMLLLATKTKFDDEGKEIGEDVELVEPFCCEFPGARVYVDDFPKKSPLPTMNEEYFDFVLKDFTVDKQKQVVWRGLPLKIENCPKGSLVVRSLSDTYCKFD